MRLAILFLTLTFIAFGLGFGWFGTTREGAKFAAILFAALTVYVFSKCVLQKHYS